MSSTRDPSQWFERILYELVMREHDPAEVVAVAKDAAVLRFPRAGGRALLLRHLPERDPGMPARLRDDIGRLAHAPLEVALIGGPPGAHALLEQSKPRFTRKPVSLYHLRDDGTLWHGGAKRAASLAVTLVPPQAPWPPPEDRRARFAALLEAQLAAAQREHEEMAGFAARMHGRRPVATWGLAATLVLVFALQWSWGATEGGPALVRMGALVPERIRDGELWRLVSCTFLHGGFAHLALNTLVLVMLGGVLERIVGTSRFLLLYAAAALAGSVASFVFGGERISVGASGALWGVLVADAVLAFRPRGLLPAAVIARAKRAAMFNLVINLANSFRPSVDMAAHLGGGAMGALLVGTGLLLAGLRPPAAIELSSENAPGSVPAPASRRQSFGLAAGAAFAVLVLAAGLALGLVRGRPWALGDRAPELTQRAVPALGVSALLPSELAAGDPVTGPEAISVLFGDPLEDPAIIELVRVSVHEEPDAPSDPGILRLIIRTALSQAPEGGRVLVSPEPIEVRDWIAMRALHELADGTIRERATLVAPDEDLVVRVDVDFLPAYRAAYEGLAARILESLQPLP